jgi:isoleucyl-tRNA synthetase
VTAKDGSGLVHMAPAFGADDYQAGIEHNLALVRPVGPDGTFTGTHWPEIEGRLVTAPDTNEMVIKRLKQEGRWYLTQPYTHPYPHCWRCSSPLIYYARDSWFVRTSAVKDRMLELNREVDWHPPEVGAGRFGEWLANNVDWALSRDRYWGTPLPVWLCDRDPSHIEVIGSYRELAQRWGKPLPAEFDPHKPFIDNYTWACSCGGTMHRTPEVIDTWFDSGSMPYAQWHYPFEHQAEFQRHFPADFICEGVDQTRGWFYSLLAIATAAFDSQAYRHVIVNELVLDPTGQKMSKTKGNVVDPWKMIEQHGADTIRLYLLASSQVWLPKRFDPQTIPEVAGKFFNALRNSYAFFARYADDWTPERSTASSQEPLLVDRWLLARLDATVETVSAAWAGYDVTAGVRAIMDFVIEDLSQWYVRVNRPRFWAPDSVADPVGLATLHGALLTVARLLAPAAPFASDWLHRALVGTSVHLAPFPVTQNRRHAELETAMDAVRRLASLAHSARQERNLPVRHPLGRMRVAVPAGVRGPMLEALLEILRLEVNVKAVEIVASDTGLVRLRPKPNFRSLGKRYGKRTPAVAAAAATLTPGQLRDLEHGSPATLELEGEPVTFHPEDVAVEREVATDWLVQSDGAFVAALDPTLDDALRREGLAREVVNRIQRVRKQAGYSYTDRIALWIDGDAAILDAVRVHAGFIQGETLARGLEVGARAPGADLEQAVDLDGRGMVVGVQRYQDGRDPRVPQHMDR